MANDLNQCNFIGRLGRDPETRYTSGGEAITSFYIAVGWKSKDKEGAEWVPITTFGKLAEICAQYLKKGSQVFISGRLKTEKYTDKDGIEKYSTKIVADTMQMLGGRQDAASTDDDHSSAPAPRKESAKRPATDSSDINDDVPF